MTILELTANWLTGGKLSEQASEIDSLVEVNREQGNNLFLLQESIQRLEQSLYSPQWRMLSMNAEEEFTREGLREITKLARIMRLANPLVKRGVQIQRLYVWAQGVNISANDEQINDVIQAFLDDERNQVELTSHQARGEKETDLQGDGNLFFRFFIDSVTGRIRLRTIDPNEIDEIICNPEDKKEPWFYRRTWSKKNLDGSVATLIEHYPDWRYIPKSKLTTGLNGRIIWDTPVYHVAVNKMGNWGICEYYDANAWAMAYKNFLEQLASVWQALARWAATLTVKGGKRGVAAARTKLGTTMTGGNDETNPPPVTGSMFLQSDGTSLQPFRTAGATMSADDGRRLMLMASMTFGFPETFYGDASVGSLATAKSLDRPTELKIIDRQTLWADIHKAILDYVVLWSVKAPKGALRGIGRYTRVPDGNQWIELLDWGETDAAINISFPSVIEHDVRETIGALIDAQTLQGRSSGDGIPLETAVREMLTELGLQDIDDIMIIWQELQDEKAQKAEDMAAQFQQGDEPEDEQDDSQETTESLLHRQTLAVSDLLISIKEAMNGHSQPH